MTVPAPSRHGNAEAPAGIRPPPTVVVRDLDADSYLESFLVAAVAAVLGIRLVLALTGYPRIGGGGFHIAHVLWGGLLMLVAIAIMLAFVGRRVKTAGAVVGGLGFGAFVDELGKFITSDNNYFYQPTVGLLYVIFVILFLAFRQIERRHPPTDQELLVNAADMLKEAIIDGAGSEEINRALTLLARSGTQTESAEAVRQALLQANLFDQREPVLPVRLAQAGRHAYDQLIRTRWFQRAIVLVFVANAMVNLLGALLAAIILVAADPLSILSAGYLLFPAAGYTASSVAVSVLSLFGVASFPRSRLDAYRWFKRAVLVSIFLVQIFLFFQNEFAALGGFAFDLVLLSGLNAMLRAEYGRAEDAFVGRPR